MWDLREGVGRGAASPPLSSVGLGPSTCTIGTASSRGSRSAGRAPGGTGDLGSDGVPNIPRTPDLTQGSPPPFSRGDVGWECIELSHSFHAQQDGYFFPELLRQEWKRLAELSLHLSVIIFSRPRMPRHRSRDPASSPAPAPSAPVAPAVPASAPLRAPAAPTALRNPIPTFFCPLPPCFQFL